MRKFPLSMYSYKQRVACWWRVMEHFPCAIETYRSRTKMNIENAKHRRFFDVVITQSCATADTFSFCFFHRIDANSALNRTHEFMLVIFGHLFEYLYFLFLVVSAYSSFRSPSLPPTSRWPPLNDFNPLHYFEPNGSKT